MSPAQVPAAEGPVVLHLGLHGESERSWLLGRNAFAAIWVPKAHVRTEFAGEAPGGVPLMRVTMPAATARWAHLIRQDLGAPAAPAGAAQAAGAAS